MTARDPAFVAQLRSAVWGEVKESEPLGRYTTYRIGGPATILLPASVDDVEAGLRVARERGIPWFALGLGSNVLMPDEGLDALVIRLGKGLDAIAGDERRWRLGAGLPAPLAARRTAEAGFAGLHKMVGVPGTVGGGVFMNAGCHGADWADVIEWVTIVDTEGKLHRKARKEIPFTYRHSGLDNSIVIEAGVKLRPEESGLLTEEVNELFRWRQQGTPFNKPCCGSVFKNPDVPPSSDLRTAGRLIDAAGLKGLRIGGAEVSSLHANYIVNIGTATAEDVRHLIGRVHRTVLERFGVELDIEVKLVGKDGRAAEVIEDY